MPPTKILFPYTGDSLGGSHISSLILAGALPPERYVPVVARHEDGPLQAYLDRQDVQAVRAPEVSYVDGGNALSRALQRKAVKAPLAGFLRAQGIGLVHTHDMRMHMTWGPAARAAGVPHIWHQRTPARAAKHARAALRADALVAVSRFTASSFPAEMQAYAQVIHNPFKQITPPAKPEARAWIQAQLSLPPETRLVCYVANLAPRKRPLTFVAAAAEMAAQEEALHFVMLGDLRAPYEAQTRAAITSAGLEGRCHLLGMQASVDPWVAGSEMMLSPGVDEALGRALIECQMLGTPLIAADSGGNREIISHEDTGLLTPPDDATAMAQAGLALLNAPERAARLASAARETASDRFALRRHLYEVLKIYDRLTSGR